MKLALVFSIAVLLVGCTNTYQVKIDGDTVSTDRDTPRRVRAGIHEGPKAEQSRRWGTGHLKPLTDAKVTVALKFKGEEKPRSVKLVPVDSKTARFQFEESGEGDNPLAEVLVHVEAPGHDPVERTFPNPPKVIAFSATVLAILDGIETDEEPPAPAPDKGAAASQKK